MGEKKIVLHAVRKSGEVKSILPSGRARDVAQDTFVRLTCGGGSAAENCKVVMWAGDSLPVGSSVDPRLHARAEQVEHKQTT